MIRTFVAVELPTGIMEQLRKTSSELKQLDLKASYPRPDSVHLTLKFLGNIEEQKVPEIALNLDEISHFAPFPVTLAELGVFPHLGNPRVVWVGIRASSELAHLQKQVESQLTGIGFARENRPFKPHLTLARIKSRRNIAALIQKIREEGKALVLGEVLVDRFHLYKSTLRPEGAQYEKLHTVVLGGDK